MYIHQSCKVRWNQSMSSSFTIVNGVRQGAVLSPSLFSLYIDKLLISLENSGFGCYVGNYFYGAAAYADDIILLSPTRSGLQEMFNICFNYFNDHDIIISTNIDPKKSKTKCIFFPYGPKENDPIKIMMGDVPLPWVDSWPHLGNDLFSGDFKFPLNCSFSKDCRHKRGKFIGKFHELWQEFGFSDPNFILQVIKIYATSFYGSCLWDFGNSDTNKLFNSWNMVIRTTFNLPRTSHRYFIENISKCEHIMATIFKRYHGFINSILTSNKKCLSSLGKIICNDAGSLTAQNINLIENKIGLQNILSLPATSISDNFIYNEVPDGDEWRIAFVEELIQLRSDNLEVVMPNGEYFTRKEINNFISMVSS